MSYNIEEEIDYNIAAEPEAAIQINRELNLARRIIEETGTNLFLTGKAGTGKTTFLRHLSESTPKRMVILAPTGVAAINAGGMTLHSFFQLPFSPFIPGKGFLGEEKRFYRMSKEKRRLIASLDLIVIDEISMVRPDLLDGIDDLLRRMRGNNLPFGGIQLLLIGDIRQLAPVVRDSERQLLRDIYPSNYFFDSLALKQSGFVTVELRTIYRQQDPRFISLLNAVRDGVAGREELNTLNHLCNPEAISETDNTIRLTTHNHIADRTNNNRLAMLPGFAETYTASLHGKFPESSYPADFNLTLKEGARVMFIKNDSGVERRYYNGMIGTVVSLSEESVTVRPDEAPETTIEVGAVEWENNGYTIDEETKAVVQTVDGIFSQIPLRLAWAITIHKSQGLTFDRAIIDACKSFAPGQLYVALSRCRSLEGLRLESRLTPESVIVDHTVNNFIETSRRNAPDTDTLNRMRNSYCRTLLAELFNFYTLGVTLRDFARVVREYVAPIHPYLFDRYREAETNFSQKIETVGERFIHLYATADINADTLSSNTLLLDKISNGCRYFLDQLEPITDLINATPKNLGNSAYQKRLDNLLDLLTFQLRIKQRILQGFLTEPFSPAAYMHLKTDAILAITAPTPKKKKSIPKLKKPKGYSTYETLALFRELGSIEAVAAKRALTENTITRHLADLINRGELPITELLSPDILSNLTATARTYLATQLEPSKPENPGPGNPESEKPESLYAFLTRHHPSLTRNQIFLFTQTYK